jgi:tRNA threonylcarbamoyladenosine biosynthesis protein TsaE
MSDTTQTVSQAPEETFALGEEIGTRLNGGEVVLLTGGLGAGKTLFTKGVLSALEYDVDGVTSPSFALVNLYKTAHFDVYHIDLWRSDGEDPVFAVGLDEILEDEMAVVIVEWAERLGAAQFGERPVYRIEILGDGDEARRICIVKSEPLATADV